MEHWVDARGRRKSELIGDGADLVDDLVRPEVAEGELLVSSRCQGRLDVRLQLEEDVVADVE